jgi:predicted HTH domain antitoxin
MNTEITISVPVNIAANLAADEVDLSRTTLEALAIEGYRGGRLSIGQLAEMLDLSVLQAEDFLNTKGVSLNYSLADFEDDLKTVDDLNRK